LGKKKGKLKKDSPESRVQSPENKKPELAAPAFAFADLGLLGERLGLLFLDRLRHYSKVFITQFKSDFFPKPNFARTTYLIAPAIRCLTSGRWSLDSGLRTASL
jgi:hypothetical protein